MDIFEVKPTFLEFKFLIKLSVDFREENDVVLFNKNVKNNYLASSKIYTKINFFAMGFEWVSFYFYWLS